MSATRSAPREETLDACSNLLRESDAPFARRGRSRNRWVSRRPGSAGADDSSFGDPSDLGDNEVDTCLGSGVVRPVRTVADSLRIFPTRQSPGKAQRPLAMMRTHAGFVRPRARAWTT